MSKKKEKCSDCDGTIEAMFTLENWGNGKCSTCHGTGEDPTFADAIVELITFEKTHPDITCEVCSGTGQCQTCGGTGFEYFSDDENDEDNTDTADEEE